MRASDTIVLAIANQPSSSWISIGIAIFVVAITAPVVFGWLFP
jgi:hypothetical protein